VAQPEAHAGKHAHSATTYVVVFVALMVLALTTYLLGEGRLPKAWALPVAMLIACIKAGLVLTFFMHLNEHKGAVRLTVVIAVFFILMLIGGTISDAATRFAPTNPRTAPFGIEATQRPAKGH
jgi:cytochrome c oxidase subunit 4